MFRKGGKENVSRTPSVDSRGVQTEEGLEKLIIAKSNQRSSTLTAQISTPSVERHDK